MVDGGDVLAGVHGRLGTITLNRPEAINALTTAMVRAIAAALDRWEHDDAVGTILIEGAGPRGLCAGGDIVMFRESALAGDGAAREFWVEEYALDARIANYPKPVVVFMDGIVMGGGVGLSGHASHRVATERLVWAMPEVQIGFCPDVGGPLLLSRAPGELGLHLALTADRIGASDAIACGFADHLVGSAQLASLRDELCDGEPGAAIAGAAARGPAQAGQPSFGRFHREVLDPCYRQPSVAAILAALKADGRPPALAAAKSIRKWSPTALEVTLQAIRRARGHASLEQSLAQDLHVSCTFLDLPDFTEGIRAAVIDKDRKPRWSPARIGGVKPEDVARFFPGTPATGSQA